MSGTKADRSGHGTSMSGDRDGLRLRDADSSGGRIAKRLVGETVLASGNRVRVTAATGDALDSRALALEAMDRYSEIMAELAD